MQNLVQILDNSARKFPNRDAIIFGQRKIKYKELQVLSDKVASELLKLGVKKGDRVSLLLNNCPDFIICYFGIVKTGAIIVTINHMLTVDEIKFILEDSTSSVLITSEVFKDKARELNLRLESLKHIITTSKTYNGFVNLKSWYNLSHTSLEPENIHSDDVAIILYTSGTTGHPKGAMLTHSNLISNVKASAATINVNHKDSFICFLPLFHSFAATVCMLMPIFIGARIVVMRSVRPFKRFIRAIRKNKVSIFVGIPSIYNILSEIKLPAILNTFLIRFLNPIRLSVSGAASLPAQVLSNFQKKFRIPLIEGYGLTETSPVVSLNPVKGRRIPGSIGLPIEGVRVKIVDEQGKDLERGQPGELLVKGPNVMKGYFRLEEATRDALKDGWLYTGDMAKMDENNYLYIVGRKKDMVNVRGLNVYPREIEDVLYQHPKIKEVAVIGIKDIHKGEVPKGFVVLKDGECADEHELISFLRGKIAAYKIPHRIEFRDSLPKNTTGKILKRLLREESVPVN